MVYALLNGVQFFGWPIAFDRFMYLIGPGGIEGWFEGVGGRRNGGDRPAAHGSFDVPVFRSERTPSITGTILASSREELEHGKNRLTGLLADGEVGRLTVHGDYGSSWADVRQMGVKLGSVDGFEADFQIQFVASDPRRYGETQTFTGTSVQPYHYGNATAIPVIEVTGSLPTGYRVNGPDGRQYRVGQALSSGQTHRIDMSTGWLYRNNVLQTAAGVVTRYQTWGIPPGSTGVAMSLTPNSGSGSMTVKVLDTFL